MNSSTRMNKLDVLQVKVEVLRAEHQDLDAAITALEEASHYDALRIKRLKKQKLALKDQIVSIENQMTPDIIA